MLRNSKSGSRRFIFVTVLLLASAPACQKQATRVDDGTKKQILHIGNGSEPPSLDPGLSTTVDAAHILRALFEGLVGNDPVTCRPIPGAAESWSISKDEKTYRFFLRKNAKWSNGAPVTAHDFVFAWKRTLSPGLASEYAYMLYYLKNAKLFNEGKLKDFSQVGVRAAADHELVVELDRVTPYFVSVLSHASTYPLHRQTVEKYGAWDSRDNSWTRPGHMVSNGPFQMDQWEVNRRVVVKKNPEYWDRDIIRLNEVHFLAYDSAQTEERAYRAGDIHITLTLPTSKIETYQAEKNPALKIGPLNGTYFYRINVKRKPFGDPRVRRALSMAIDRQLIVERITRGGQAPAYNLTPPGLDGFTARSRIEYSPEKARKLLAQAGFPNGLGIRRIEILYNTLEGHKLIAEAIQQMWKKELNLDVALVNQDWKVSLDTMRSLNYDIARMAWIGDYLDPNTFLDMLVTGGGNNQTGWSNSTYDGLIREASHTSGPKRHEIFQKAEDLLVDESPIIPIYTYTRVQLVHPDVRGFQLNLQEVIPWKWMYLERTEGGS